MLFFFKGFCVVEMFAQINEADSKGLNRSCFIGLTFLLGITPNLFGFLEIFSQFDPLLMDNFVPPLIFNLFLLDLHDI